MSHGFQPASGDGARIRLAAEEAAVMRALMGQLLDLLGDDDNDNPEPLAGTDGLAISENTIAPDDPVLARLFPDGYREDPEAAGEFRRYTEAGLRAGKREAARVVLETLKDRGEIVLDPEQCQAWLRALNDVRLALGTRLNITEESYGQFDDLSWNDPQYPALAAYDWLTHLQESLVRALS